jgi:hypothetical protein
MQIMTQQLSPNGKLL